MQPINQPKNNQPKISWVGGEFRTKCVVGLDRDGVINRDLGTYCHRVEDFDPIPGSIDAIAELRRKGYKITVITDQGGIEKGIYTQQDVDTVHEHMLKLLGEAGCFSIDGIYYSASSRKEDPFAKPNVGMFNIGAKPVLVRTGYGAETEKDLNKWTYRKIKQRTIIFDNLAQFVESLA